MKKIPFTLLIIIQLFFSSCSVTSKETYSVLNSFLSQESYFKKNDTILLLNKTYPLKLIKDFPLNWQAENTSKEDNSSLYRILWTETTKTVTLEQPTIAYLRNQITNEQENLIWKQNKIIRSKTIVTEPDSIYLNFAKYSEVKTKKSLAVYSLTRPIFSKGHTICIFGFYRGINFSQQTIEPLGLIVMEKENDKWLYRGVIKGYGND